jgi:hypothetical protein
MYTTVSLVTDNKEYLILRPWIIFEFVRHNSFLVQHILAVSGRRVVRRHSFRSLSTLTSAPLCQEMLDLLRVVS